MMNPAFRLPKAIRNFWSDTQGAITAFTVMSFLTMFMAVGMAVDFIRHEANRAELQDALDRGVLAAAASQASTLTELTDIVEGYLRATNYISSGYSLNVYNNSTFATRKIQANLSYSTDTMALKLAGISHLTVGASATAYQGVSDIEISLALDISGSMARERTSTSSTTTDLLNNYPYASKLDYEAGVTSASRLDVLRVSANRFIDEVLNSTNQGDHNGKSHPVLRACECGYHRLQCAQRHAGSQLFKLCGNGIHRF